MSSCKECREQAEVFYSEVVASKLERANLRQFIVILILLITLIASNLGWIYYESQFEDCVQTITATQDGGGNNVVSGGDYNGAESTNNN